MVKSDDPLEKITTAQAIQILLDNYRSSGYYQAAQARVQEISQFVSVPTGILTPFPRSDLLLCL